MNNLKHWIKDYLHAIHKHSMSFIYRNPPEHYLNYVKDNRKPIILIPGLLEKWHFLKEIADPLSLLGHPIYVLEKLEYNTEKIHHTAKSVRALIDEKKLKDVIIIAHSKGGLIAKDILVSLNKDEKVKKVITIATPFSGSEIIKYIPSEITKELSPDSRFIKNLSEEKEINRKIVSIFGTFDNHVWPETSSQLDGAKNIQVHVHGHHLILSSKKVRKIILAEVLES